MSWWQIGKKEGHCSTGQSPQWALVLMEEEELEVLEDDEEEEDVLLEVNVNLVL